MAAYSPGGRGPVAGVGMGLRAPHFRQLAGQDHGIPWLELLADNLVGRGGVVPRQLDVLAERYALTLHCVGMNLGGTDPLDPGYLRAIGALARRLGVSLVSDHLCFTAHRGSHYHELLPLPFDDESVRHVASRIVRVQDMLGCRIAVENVSAYLRAKAPLEEAAFIAAVCAEADCHLLLDINNLYVNQVNLGFDAARALGMLPLSRVREIHLAGYRETDGYLVDTHDCAVAEPVWALFRQASRLLPSVPVCIEWDHQVPPLHVLIAEVRRAAAVGLLEAGAVA